MSSILKPNCDSMDKSTQSDPTIDPTIDSMDRMTKNKSTQSDPTNDSIDDNNIWLRMCRYCAEFCLISAVVISIARWCFTYIVICYNCYMIVAKVVELFRTYVSEDVRLKFKYY